MRSLLGPDHYTAIFRGASITPDGDLTEHEAHLNVFNGHAAVTISFVSAERICETAHLQPHTAHTDCDLTERWLQAEPSQGSAAAILVTATARVGAHEAIDPVSRSRLFDFSHTRNYDCQAFEFSDETSHYEPTANSSPCFESAKPPAPTTSAKPAQPTQTTPPKPSTGAASPGPGSRLRAQS